MNLGAFASSIWLKVLNAIFKETIFSAILAAVVVFTALTVIFIVYNPFKEKK